MYGKGKGDLGKRKISPKTMKYEGKNGSHILDGQVIFCPGYPDLLKNMVMPLTNTHQKYRKIGN